MARLARLELTQDELDEFGKELPEIIKYVEQLQQIDTDGLEPTNQVTGLTNVYRDDVVIDYGYQPADLLKNVPTVDGDQIKVKRMIG